MVAGLVVHLGERTVWAVVCLTVGIIIGRATS